MKIILLPLAPLLLNTARVLLHSRPRPRPGPNATDAFLVLGTAQYDGRPSRQFAARLDHALTRARQLPATRVVTVGGNLPGDRFTEADVGKTYLVEHGLASERIRAVPRGSDTRGSCEAVLDQVPGAAELRFTLITDPNHALRARRIARLAGLRATVDPTPSSPTKFPGRGWWLSLSHEVGGLLVVDVSFLLGRGVADRVEETLRQVQGWLRPSRRARHEQLRCQR